MSTFVDPRYGDLSLANLLPSVVARLDGEIPLIEIPEARQYVVLLIDGLGWHQLREHAAHAETMAGLLDRGHRLTCSVPSTTATSLTSLGCGATPGEHGVVGYSFYEPTVGRVINSLTWEGGPDDIEGFAQKPTVFQRLASQGRPSAAVTLGRFAGSALTRVAFAGTRLFPVANEGDVDEITGHVTEALRESDVVYLYERLLDSDGHSHGTGSWQWLDRLAVIDDHVAHLVETLPPSVCLLITGDHGMLNVPEDTRVVVEDEPRLAGYSHLGGEPRFRHIYGEDPRALAWAWESVFGERALVLRREEAIEAGWFGPNVSNMSSARIGDVVAAMTGTWAAMTYATPGEFSLVGMHGSLTAAEMEVPLLMHGGGR
ncbi:alkaline phosphatase family protein [Tessaracoccus sp. MC1865]|uniref:alkaline phosphatase family protein n=1 Tax=Tessaracoccus sp. MC1865 TaxID=2760310 RepID=UPI0015FFA698|nr:nucleotide pyrophosphatase/phosphodiesterase family protein [Tessaracoccus sp. MC1865]MBB1483329.1 alkaline phosphatase family protein [Tessaracoccus sp. MC1865]QTO36446.1 alkaline phosphatase family protein [Tessaracoccus sp. MC1865]